MRTRLRTYARRHWRGIVNALTLVAMGFLIYALREEIFQTMENIKQIQYWVLLLIIPIQFINYDAYARMYGKILAHLGQPVSYWRLYRVTLEHNFVNHALPSGGVSGISYFGVRLHNYGVTAGTSTLLQLIKFILVFISFQVLVVVGLFALAVGNKASNMMILVSAVIVTTSVLGSLAALYVVESKARISAFFYGLTKFVNRVIHLVRPNHPETIALDNLHGFLDDMHENYKKLKANIAPIRAGFFHALVGNITEIVTIYVVYIAFGEWVNLGAIIIAYAIANFAGLISVLPGGVGVYEALMTATLAAGGVPAALSIPVVVAYRIISMAVQLPPGWLLYHLAVRNGASNAK